MNDRTEQRSLPLRTLALLALLVIVMIVPSIAALRQIHQVKANTKKVDITAARLDRVVATLYEDALTQCERVNVLRGGVNENASIIYRVLLNAAQSNSTAAKAYEAIIHDVDYRPSTDCVSAVSRGRLYTPPALIPLYKLDRAGRFDRETGRVK